MTDSLQLFLNEAGRYPLLTAAEEVELAKRIERGDLAAKERMITSQPAAGRLDRPPLPDAGDHPRRPDPGGRDRPDPRDREVRLAQGLQVLDLRDLVDPPGGAARRRQQGAHDPDPGARRRARAEGRAHRARALGASSGYAPTDEEIAKHAKLPLAQVREVREAARAVASTDAPIGADGDTSFGELFAAGGPTTEDEVDATIRGDAVRRAVAKLPDRQRDVISLRFGLVGDGPNSLEQIGKQLGITRERVRQIEADALRRLAADEAIADAA